MTDRPKRPRDANQLAKFIVDRSTMDADALKAHQEELLKKPQALKTGQPRLKRKDDK